MEPPPAFKPNLLGLAQGHAVDRLERPLCEGLTDHGVHMLANPGVMDLRGVPREVRLGEADRFAGHGEGENPFHRLNPGNIPLGGLIEPGLLQQPQSSQGFAQQRIVELPRRVKSNEELPFLRGGDSQRHLADEGRRGPLRPILGFRYPV